MRLMQPEMVYSYPLWAVGLVLVAAAVAGAAALELLVRRLLPPSLRRSHNDVAAAMFSIVGVTYAVLLAFVAMLAWEGFNHAAAVTSAEATLLADLDAAAEGLAAPGLRSALAGYATQVIDAEWPALAAGRPATAAEASLARIDHAIATVTPADSAGINRHALLLQTLARLRDARAERLLAAGTTIPPIVWTVTVLGGIITIAFGSFLGAPSLGMHLAMSALLAVSGCLVLLLIVALSNPFRGDFHVTAAPFQAVLARFGAAPAGGEALTPPAAARDSLQ